MAKGGGINALIAYGPQIFKKVGSFFYPYKMRKHLSSQRLPASVVAGQAGVCLYLGLQAEMDPLSLASSVYE